MPSNELASSACSNLGKYWLSQLHGCRCSVRAAMMKLRQIHRGINTGGRLSWLRASVGAGSGWSAARHRQCCACAQCVPRFSEKSVKICRKANEAGFSETPKRWFVQRYSSFGMLSSLRQGKRHSAVRRPHRKPPPCRWIGGRHSVVRQFICSMSR